jgi:hypothetical protein
MSDRPNGRIGGGEPRRRPPNTPSTSLPQDSIDARRVTRPPRAILLAAIALIGAIVVAGCGGGGSSPPVANVTSTTTTTTSSPASTATATTSRSRTATTSTSSSATTPSKGNAGGALVEWAKCMRSHGDPSQPDPTIDAHGGINVSIPDTAGTAASLSNAVHNGTAPCNQYLAAATAALRAGARDLTPPNQTALVSYAQCMRANGVPNYPDPGTGESSNLNGIDMNSPFFIRANKVCGHKIHAPSWWTNGWGPPGNISVSSGPLCGNSVCAPTSGANRPRRGASGANGPATGD